MIANNVTIEDFAHTGTMEMPITTLFIGSYHRAIYILTMLNDKEEAIATKCWRVRFDDSQTKTNFLALCPDAVSSDGWFLVMDCVIRGWLIDQGGITLQEVVAIEFASLRLRKRFIAETDH